MNLNIQLKKSIIYFFLILFLISSCGTHVPVETVEWEPDGEGFRQFKTNDINFEDYTFWYYMNASYQDPMDYVETEVKKISGSDFGGLGILFCFQDHDNFYVYVIDVSGYYAVYKRQYGSWSVIIDWPYSSALNTGFNSLNTLKVSFDSPGSTFTLYANDIVIDSFTDNSFTGGKSGYECHISGGENFPAVAEDFRFAQLYPNTDP